MTDTLVDRAEAEYWLRALDLVGDELTKCSADRFEDKRDKFVSIVRMATSQLAAERLSTRTRATKIEEAARYFLQALDDGCVDLRGPSRDLRALLAEDQETSKESA